MKKKIALITLIALLAVACIGFGGCETEPCSLCNDNPQSLYNYLREFVSTTATCTSAGVATYTCPTCGKTFEEAQDALGHDYEVTKNEATCQKGGTIYYACSRCGISKSEYSKASSSYHKWTLISSSETISVETKKYKCSLCDETKTETSKVSMGSKLSNTNEKFYYATAAAIRIVKGELKYPSNAKFLQESLMEVHYNSSTGNYFIEGAVSACNALGVYTDYYFIVKTKIKESGSKFTWYDYDCELSN